MTSERLKIEEPRPGLAIVIDIVTGGPHRKNHMLERLLLVALCMRAIAGDTFLSRHTAPPDAPVAPGAVCHNRTNRDSPPLDRLAGQHILACGFQYRPFLDRAILPDGGSVWTGFDVDLLTSMAARLRFNFTIVPKEKLPTELWGEFVRRILNDCDLVLTYWIHEVDRMEEMRQLNGHHDTSVYLTTRPPEVKERNLWERAFSFEKPFSAAAWMSIIITLTVGGLFMRYLEAEDEWSCSTVADDSIAEISKAAAKEVAKIHAYSATTHALYSAAAGALWGDHEPPRTKSGSIALLGYGFVVLVLTASYTANLATFMVDRNRVELAVNSMDDLDSRTGQAESACVNPDFHANLARVLSRLYPGLRYEVTRTPVEALASGTSCGAYLTYNHPAEMADPDACWLHTIGQALFNSEAGWITPWMSACVAQPIELAMMELQWNGVLDDLYSLYMGRPPTCTMPTARRRRHLAASTSQARPPIMTASSQQAGPTIIGRALKGSTRASNEEDGIHADSSDASSDMALGWQDLVGLHCIYLMLLVTLAANKMVHKMVKAHRARAAPPSVPRSPSPPRDMEAGVEHHVDAAVAATTTTLERRRACAEASSAALPTVRVAPMVVDAVVGKDKDGSEKVVAMAAKVIAAAVASGASMEAAAAAGSAVAAALAAELAGSGESADVLLGFSSENAAAKATAAGPMGGAVVAARQASPSTFNPSSGSARQRLQEWIQF